jgi:hypothetical protein
MFIYLEKKCSALFKRYLHPKLDPTIEKTLKIYQEKHHPDEYALALLATKLVAEGVRIQPMVDDSILDARLQNATITFWMTALAGCIVSVSFYFTNTITSVPAVFVPLLGSFAAWCVSIGTIPIFYNKRISGAMESVVLVFETPDNGKTDNELRGEVATLKVSVHELKLRVIELSQQLVERSTQPRENGVTNDCRISVHEMRFWHSTPEVKEENTVPKHELLSAMSKELELCADNTSLLYNSPGA